MTDEAKNPDALVGAKAIGATMGMSARAAYQMLETKQLDGVAQKIGNKWLASKKRLLKRVFGEDGNV
jgi:hypothetical protein